MTTNPTPPATVESEVYNALTHALFIIKCLRDGIDIGEKLPDGLTRIERLHERLAAQPSDAEWMKEAALKINRLILMASGKASQPDDTPEEDRITDADIDALEAALLAHLSARPSAEQPDSALRQACEDFRDAVLNQRGNLEEPCLGNDQTNAVLAEFDSTVASLTTEPAKLTMPSSWDEKALATAQEIALMWGQGRSQFVSRIQVAVMDAMRWTCNAPKDASGVPLGEWGGYRVGKGLPADMPRSEAVAAPDHIGDTNKMVAPLAVGTAGSEGRDAPGVKGLDDAQG
jgi:hypothetical protein